MDHQKIADNFSRYALTYDDYSTIQQETFQKLLTLSGGLSPQRLLDIGCGTGKNTVFLAMKYPSSSVTAIDSAAAMVRHASQKYPHPAITYKVENIDTLPEEEQFDLIVSNAVLQWVPDMAKTVQKIRTLLNKEGRMAIALFGPQTFIELKTVLTDVLGRDIRIAANTFKPLDPIRAALQHTFANTYLKREVSVRDTPSLRDLLYHIKYTGTQGTGIKEKKIWTPRFIQKLEEIYLERYGRIKTTYELIYALGIKEQP